MNIQSLSIVVPTGQCWNNCPYCVSKMHHEDYGKSIFTDKYFSIPDSYRKRMQFVRDEGCNSMILTGTAEPQQNMPFILNLLRANQALRNPFYNITLQTTGSGLAKEDIERMVFFGLTTISFSISSFNADRNAELVGMPENKKKNFYAINQIAKEFNLVTRASINLTDEFAQWAPEYYFSWAKLNHFDQITFRKIYSDGDNEQSKWISEHSYPEEQLATLGHYISRNGKQILRLPYGQIKYSVHGISTVMDDDCMANCCRTDDLKYAILRPNGHLYSHWDDPGTLIF